MVSADNCLGGMALSLVYGAPAEIDYLQGLEIKGVRTSLHRLWRFPARSKVWEHHYCAVNERNVFPHGNRKHSSAAVRRTARMRPSFEVTEPGDGATNLIL
jgi:hypothetical protein